MPAVDRDFPMIGETVGLWRLVGGLGRGGMGEVYEAEYDFIHIISLRFPAERQAEVRDGLAQLPRAEQARLAAEVLGTELPADARFAIKICNARSGTAGHRRFLQEAELAAKLGDHPYIVSVHAVNGGIDAASPTGRRLELDRGRWRDVAFMVMDLATRTWDHTRLSIGEAVHIVRCIATALDHAHSKGVVHRDLKPENILGTVEHPLLTDFGIAKELDQSEGDGLTRTGQIIGTLDYMSPEQATDAKRVDSRSDIYSLGVVLYEFATGGNLPYSHKLDRESCLAAIRSERTPPKWPREHLPGFPVGLERIILKAMAHRMEDRYQAMSDFIHDLDRFTRGEWIGLFGRIHVRDWMRFQGRFRPRTVWGLGLAGAAGLGFAAWLVVVPMFDARRTSLATRISQLESAVAQLRSRQRDQLSPVDHAMLKELLGSSSGLSGHEDLARRARQVEQDVRTYSRLSVLFDGRGDGDDRLALQQAMDVQSAPWRVHTDGLRIEGFFTATIGPYGRGRSVMLIELQSSDWSRFRIEARSDAPAAGWLRWSVRGGRLLLEHVQRDGRATLLRDDPEPGWSVRLQAEWTTAGLMVGLGGQPEPQRVSAPGLSPTAAVEWSFDLDNGATLVRLYAGGAGP